MWREQTPPTFSRWIRDTTSFLKLEKNQIHSERLYTEFWENLDPFREHTKPTTTKWLEGETLPHVCFWPMWLLFVMSNCIDSSRKSIKNVKQKNCSANISEPSKIKKGSSLLYFPHLPLPIGAALATEMLRWPNIINHVTLNYNQYQNTHLVW